MCTYLISHCLHKVKIARLTGGLFEGEGIIFVSIMEARGLTILGIVFGEDLDISSLWSSLDEKLAVSGIMDLLAEMTTYEKRSMRLNAFVVTFYLLYLSLIIFLHES